LAPRFRANSFARYSLETIIRLPKFDLCMNAVAGDGKARSQVAHTRNP
jgi:hypothetical protein